MALQPTEAVVTTVGDVGARPSERARCPVVAALDAPAAEHGRSDAGADRQEQCVVPARRGALGRLGEHCQVGVVAHGDGAGSERRFRRGGRDERGDVDPVEVPEVGHPDARRPDDESRHGEADADDRAAFTGASRGSIRARPRAAPSVVGAGESPSSTMRPCTGPVPSAPVAPARRRVPPRSMPTTIGSARPSADGVIHSTHCVRCCGRRSAAGRRTPRAAG